MKTTSSKLQHQVIVTLVGLSSIALAIGISMANMGSFEKQSLPEKEVELTKVSIKHIHPDRYQAQVVAYGSASPRYALDLTSEVSGRVTHLSEQLESGNTVKKGEVLITIDDRLYQQAVANAKTQVSDARVALLQEELNVQQAEQEWRRSGLQGQPDSELVLRQPQLLAAQNKLEYSEKSLLQAKADLQKTQVTAPFSALIINRQVQPSSYLQSGSQIAQLYNTDVIDISLALSESQWQQLPPLKTMISEGWPVEISHTANNKTANTSGESKEKWTGRVTRGEQHMNDSSRQRSLVVSVERPLEQSPPLFPGTFIQAKISGESIDNLWQLPASAITQDNQFWYLTQDDELKVIAADVRFSHADKVYLNPPASFNQTRVLTHPLSSYLPGMKVLPNSKASNSEPFNPETITEAE